MHFGEVKTKSILFASKWRLKNVHQLNIRYKAALTSYISWMHVRRDNVGWINGNKDYKQKKQKKWEIKISLKQK